jgi:hypothetical protein
MIAAKLGGKPIQIPTQWSDCTYAMYCRLVQAVDMAARIQVIAPGKLSKANIRLLSDVLEFTNYPDLALIYAVPYESDLNIGARSYGELEKCKMALQTADNKTLAIGTLIKTYLHEDADDQPLPAAIGKGALIIGRMDEFMKRYSELYQYDPTIEEIRAGVDRMNQFGFMGTAIQMARKYGTTHDAILQWPASEVYHTLLYDKVQADISRAYQAQFK